MRRIVGAAVLGLMAAGAVLADQGPVAIKLKKAGPGDVVRETKAESTEQKVTITAMGRDQVKGEKSVVKFVFTDEVIERPAGAPKPTKVKRTYQTADLTTAAGAQDLGLKGKTVLIEKKGDKYEFTIDGAAVSAKAAEILGQEFSARKQSTEDDLIPKKPVQVGEPWPIDVAKATAEFSANMVFDLDKSTATGRLVKVSDKGGKKFGVIELRMELVVAKLKQQQGEIPLKEGSKLSIAFTMDGCIDGSEATGGGKMTMTGKLSGEVPGVAQVVIDITSTATGTTTEVRPK